jgi:transketolase
MKLEELSKKVRKDILAMALETGEGHIAPAYSCTDIIVTLYEKILKPEDKFILSKGHACFAQYCMLRIKGKNPTIRGHPDIEESEGIACTTGSLGHGLPMAVGMALARKIQHKKGKIYVLMGDGECQEGTTWESMNLAKKYELDNLVIIVDHNKLQALCALVIPDDDLQQKFEAFGAIVCCPDGHSHEHLITCLTHCKRGDKPKVVIAHTIKGKGMSFAEGEPEWHNKIPVGEQLNKLKEELE